MSVVSRLLFFIVLCAAAHVAAATPVTGSLDLTAYRGKVVVVDFWASWCVPCRQSLPWLNAMRKKYAERGLVVIGINVDRDRSEAERFLKEVPATFNVIFDPSGELASAFDVPGMPSTFVFGPDGLLVAKHIGFRNALRDEREAELQALLERPN